MFLIDSKYTAKDSRYQVNLRDFEGSELYKHSLIDMAGPDTALWRFVPLILGLEVKPEANSYRVRQTVRHLRFDHAQSINVAPAPTQPS